MLHISDERANYLYEGAHPITGEFISCKWKDFNQADLAAIYDADPSNRYLFSGGEPEIFNPKVTVKKEPLNVNTTAPSTATARITTATKAD